MRPKTISLVLICIAAFGLSLVTPAQAQIGLKEPRGFDAGSIRTAVGVDLGSLGLSPEQAKRASSGEQKHYMVFNSDQFANLAAGSDQYWNGSVFIPAPERTGRLIQVVVKESTWSYSGWWYKNPDGSISRIFKDGSGSRIGVVTMAGDGSVLAVIDLDRDGVAESVEQILPGGRSIVMLDRLGLRMQELWHSGHNPFCKPSATSPAKITSSRDRPDIGLPDDPPATIDLCKTEKDSPGISTERPAGTPGAAKRDPNTIEQMCQAFAGRPRIPGQDLGRDDPSPLTRWVAGIIFNGTDGVPDGVAAQLGRSLVLWPAVGIAAAVDVLVHEVTHPMGMTFGSDSSERPARSGTASTPGSARRPVGPSPADTLEQLCKSHGDESKRWDNKIRGAAAAIEKECPNPAGQPALSARDKAPKQSVSLYCSEGQQEETRDRAATENLFGFSDKGCGLAERPGPDGRCRQRTFRGRGGQLVVAYGETLAVQICPERVCTRPER